LTQGQNRLRILGKKGRGKMAGQKTPDEDHTSLRESPAGKRIIGVIQKEQTSF